MSRLAIGLDSTRDHLQEALNTVRREQSPGLVDAVRALIYLRDADRCKTVYGKAPRWLLAAEAMERSTRNLIREKSGNLAGIQHLRTRLLAEMPLRLVASAHETHQMYLAKVAKSKRADVQLRASEKAMHEFEDLSLLFALPAEVLEWADHYRTYWRDQSTLLELGERTEG